MARNALSQRRVWGSKLKCNFTLKGKIIVKRALAVLAVAVALVDASCFGQNSAWNYSVDKNVMDNNKSTEFAMTDGNKTTLVVRCKTRCEVYLKLNDTIFADQTSVRVKFNSSMPKRFSVSRGEGSDSLFFTQPVEFLRAVRDNGGYVFIEYSPYEKIPDTDKLGVWNLPPTILVRLGGK